MGKTSDNLFADGFSGKMGKNMVFRQKRSGAVVVAKAPRKTRKPVKETALKTRRTFKDGVAYAKAIMNNPVNAALKEAYGLGVKGDESAYNVALRDFCVSPTVTDINFKSYKGVQGDKIVIRAEDDFKVEAVRVTLHAADGELLEEGDAVLDAKGVNWEYVSTEPNNQLAGTSITAVARDIPGNEGQLVSII